MKTDLIIFLVMIAAAFVPWTIMIIFLSSKLKELINKTEPPSTLTPFIALFASLIIIMKIKDEGVVDYTELFRLSYFWNWFWGVIVANVLGVIITIAIVFRKK